MGNVLRSAIAGALVLGTVSAAPIEASAMPVAAATSQGMGQGADIETVYWRYGYRRPWGWHRPGWRRYGWGWRRPYWRVRHPYRRFYRW